MPGYTIKNFDAIDNANSDPAIPVDARFARKHLESEHLGVTRLRYEPDVHLPLGHNHREQEEVYVVVSGSGRVKLDDDVHDIGPWDLIRVAPATVRAFASGPDGLELLAIGSDRPEGGDGEIHRDWWTG
jgi:mannose-6-phosphate isomerase-like protein (cupin superfamily)